MNQKYESFTCQNEIYVKYEIWKSQKSVLSVNAYSTFRRSKTHIDTFLLYSKLAVQNFLSIFTSYILYLEREATGLDAPPLVRGGEMACAVL